MDDTLKDKQIMILNKISYKFTNPKRFDIIVINHEEDLIKRVIGLPGETLEYIDNILYINGKEVAEPFLKQETKDFNITELGYDKIPDNCYIALGDNRLLSLDSRYYGCFTKEEILGKTSLVIYPFKDFGYKNKN